MRRREFIALLGGAAATWPVATSAQQTGKLPIVGFLGASASGFSPWAAAFAARMRELGWVEGRTITIEYRWSEGRPERYAEIAAEFVRLNVDVILTVGSAVPIVRTGDHGYSHRICGGNRSGRQRSGRKSGETRRQRHRIVHPSERACRQAVRILA